MSRTQIPSPFLLSSPDYHVAAAERHEEAAECHRNAAAHYNYGNYQVANEHALLAKSYGQQAEEQCLLAMKVTEYDKTDM